MYKGIQHNFIKNLIFLNVERRNILGAYFGMFLF